MMLFPFLLLFGLKVNPAAHTLQLNISNITAGKGNVMIAVHNKENFLKSRLVEKSIPASASSLQLHLELPDGQYAVAIYQDLNQNKQLDTGMFGIPEEPYGFSNNTRPKFRAPTFDETKFGLYNKLSLSIKLDKW